MIPLKNKEIVDSGTARTVKFSLIQAILTVGRTFAATLVISA